MFTLQISLINTTGNDTYSISGLRAVDEYLRLGLPPTARLELNRYYAVSIQLTEAQARLLPHLFQSADYASLSVPLSMLVAGEVHLGSQGRAIPAAIKSDRAVMLALALKS